MIDLTASCRNFYDTDLSPLKFITMSFDIVPTELLETIFSHLDDRRDLAASRLVCRRWAATVEPFLASRTCLKVAHRVRFKNDSDGKMVEQTRMIEKELLMELNQRYTSLSIECADDWKEWRNGKNVEKLLDACQECFSVWKLRLRITPDVALAGLFVDRRDWLENLTELHVELGSIFYEEPQQDTEIEVMLPALKRLTWIQEDEIEKDENEDEHDGEEEDFVERYVPCYTYVLNVPNLERLKVRINRTINGIRMNSTLQVDPDVCCLFQPRLKLKSCEKLQHLEVEGLLQVRSEYVDGCEAFLQNLKSLSFGKCYTYVIQIICEKCTKLEELIIDRPLGAILPFQTISNLFRLLKKLTLRGVNGAFEEWSNIELPQLHYLRLVDMTASLSLKHITLTVPQLTTLVVSRLDYDLLNLPHKEQIRTMAVELDCWSESGWKAAPPNVTELFLRQKFKEPTEAQHYLQYFPNLRRLTVYGALGTILNCAVVQKDLPLLEYFHGHEVALRLADIHHLKHLKSLILSHCTLTTTTGDKDVTLKQLDYFRVKRVTLEGSSWECFPIYGNERQPPIEIEEQQLTNDRGRTFSSRNFRLKRWAPSNPM